jgi:hypothetical protein
MLDVEKVKGLIVQTEEVIGDPSPGTLGLLGAQWRIAVLTLTEKGGRRSISWRCFSSFCLETRGGEYIEGLWMRVRTLLRSEELSPMRDHRCCLEPLGVDLSELGTHAEGGVGGVFEDWIRGFPLLQLESRLPSDQVDNRSSSFNPRRWFGRNRFYTI